MPQARSTTSASGSREDIRILLLSDAAKQYNSNQLQDCMIIVIPDTGKAEFNGSHLIKTGKSAGKMSKATFILGELGSSFAGELAPWTQGEGPVKGLDVFVKLSVLARPPNTNGTTIDEALNRPKTDNERLLEAVPSNGHIATA